MPRPEDPGKGKGTREMRRAARKAAWEPRNAPRRAAHKAEVLASIEEERQPGGADAEP